MHGKEIDKTQIKTQKHSCSVVCTSVFSSSSYISVTSFGLSITAVRLIRPLPPPCGLPPLTHSSSSASHIISVHHRYQLSTHLCSLSCLMLSSSHHSNKCFQFWVVCKRWYLCSNYIWHLSDAVTILHHSAKRVLLVRMCWQFSTKKKRMRSAKCVEVKIGNGPFGSENGV